MMPRTAGAALLTPEQRKANKRANDARYREAYKGVAYLDQTEMQAPPPPRYVLKEREIRRRIPPASFTAKTFGDPLPGYSGKDNVRRKLSVQDALEICSLHTGRRGEVITLAASYRVSRTTILNVLDGSWFDHLLPSSPKFSDDYQED